MNDNSLAHYGVLGMKWGVRKDRGTKQSSNDRKIEKAERLRKQPLANSYSQEEYRKDILRRGPRRANRINRIIQKSKGRYSVSTARAMDTNIRRSNRELATGGAYLVGVGLLLFGPMLAVNGLNKLSNIAESREAARGAEAAANLFANNKGLTSYATIALQAGADGVHRYVRNL